MPARDPARPAPERTRWLLFAFAFAVLADPVSSVTFAIEAALRALHGDLALLLPTMTVVVGVVAIVVVNYLQVVRRFPDGGGAAAATALAFGTGWAFLPIGALLTDFVLTAAVSVSAAAAALVAYRPSLAGRRLELAAGLLAVVAAIMLLGHVGRLLFAVLTVLFVLAGAAVLVSGVARPVVGPAPVPVAGLAHRWAPVAVILAFPVAMALATGVEAPSSAIAQLPQLSPAGRRRAGALTLWLTLAIVGTLTLALTALDVARHVGLPGPAATLVADLARAAAPPPLFAAFQFASALVLLAAACSAFQAGPGLLKALAREPAGGPGAPVAEEYGESLPTPGLLTPWLGRTNRVHTPYHGVLIYLVITAAVVVAAGARTQTLVRYYAVAVFVSFGFALAAMTRFSWRERRWPAWAGNAVGLVLVAFTLGVNLARVYPIGSLAASGALAGGLWWRWVRAGRPLGRHRWISPAPGRNGSPRGEAA